MVNNGPLPMRPSPWLLDNWQLTPGNCFSKNASAEDTTARASHPNLSLGRYAEVGQQNSAVPTYESNLSFPKWKSAIARLCRGIRDCSQPLASVIGVQDSLRLDDSRVVGTNSEKLCLQLLERLQPPIRKLRHWTGRAFFLHLLIERARLVGPVALLIQRCQQELRRALAYGSGGMIGQVLVECDGLGIAIGVAINAGQRQLRQAGNLPVAAAGNVLQGLFRGGVVAHVVKGYAGEVAGHASRLGKGVLVGDAGELGIADLGALLRRGKAQHVRRGRRARGTDGSVVLLDRSAKLALGLLVAIGHVSPTAADNRHKDGNSDSYGDQLGLMFHHPGNGFGGRCPK